VDRNDSPANKVTLDPLLEALHARHLQMREEYSRELAARDRQIVKLNNKINALEGKESNAGERTVRPRAERKR
jgi:hypothetical protein